MLNKLVVSRFSQNSLLYVFTESEYVTHSLIKIPHSCFSQKWVRFVQYCIHQNFQNSHKISH